MQIVENMYEMKVIWDKNLSVKDFKVRNSSKK